MSRTLQTSETYSLNSYMQEAVPTFESISIEEQICRFGIPARQSDFISIILFTKGSGKLCINGLDLDIRPGMLGLLQPYHIYSINMESEPQITFYRCSFPISVLMYLDVKKRYTDADYSVLETGNPVVILEKQLFNLTKAAFAEMLEEKSKLQSYYDLLILGNLFRIIGIYNRQNERQLLKNSPAEHSMAWKALQYIHLNFNQTGFDSALVSKELGIDPLKLGHLLRLLTGEGFSGTLDEVRIRHACAMMTFEELSIAFIARYIGYNSMSTFHRAFKKFKGVTPDQYRKGLYSPPVCKSTHRDTGWRILVYLLENYAEDIKPGDIAGKLFIGEDTLINIISQNFNLTLAQLLEQIRLSYACSMLGAGQLQIYDIAVAVGFNTLRTFTRSFQRHLGTSPSKYRNSILELSKKVPE